MIFFLFKPLNIKQQKFVDVPLFELASFTLFELNNQSLITVMKGNKAIRYRDRYTVENINYTDNAKEYIANMKANNGIYKNDTVDLSGDVVYSREDELTFETQDITYNKKTNIARSKSDFIARRGDDTIIGKSIQYNNILKTIESKDVVVKYNIKER